MPVRAESFSFVPLKAGQKKKSYYSVTSAHSSEVPVTTGTSGREIHLDAKRRNHRNCLETEMNHE